MTHLFTTRVYYEDTDMAGIVYYANYLRYIERARTEYVRSLGVDQSALRANGVVFAVTRIEADYLSPARLEEDLRVETSTVAVTRVRMILSQDVFRGETLLFRSVVTLVAMSIDGKPVRLPMELAAGRS